MSHSNAIREDYGLSSEILIWALDAKQAVVQQWSACFMFVEVFLSHHTAVGHVFTSKMLSTRLKAYDVV